MDEWVSLEQLKKLPPKRKRKQSEDPETAVALLDDPDHDPVTRAKNIQFIVLGSYKIAAWYFSPYPQEVCSNAQETLYICEYCLNYMDRGLRRHKEKCHMRCPPGREIYRDGKLSAFEVDGRDHKIFCQNLCLLSKLFLDHKTLYYDVEPFLFYILCEVDESGCHVVGYFSKEKNSTQGYNLSCILIYPPYQRKGYGKFLISLSYELTRRENKTGSPEKPISDLGLISYKSYWAHALIQAINARRGHKAKGGVTVRDLANETGICEADVTATMQDIGLLLQWKGNIFICISNSIQANAIARSRRIKVINPESLVWSPHVTTKADM